MQASSMVGKVCLVTGGNSGIGRETALGLARAGARVVIMARDRARGEAAVADVGAATDPYRISLLVADLSSQSSVREAAREFMRTQPRLDVLVNNAGTFISRRRASIDGIELTVATNYLGPFLLTHCLLPVLRESAPSRIINVSSDLHRRATLDLHDLGLRRRPYRFLEAYAASKLMLSAFSHELARRLRGTGISVYSAHPGHVATNLGDENEVPGLGVVRMLCRPFLASPREGARTSLFLATSDALSRDSGKYFARCAPAAPSPLALDPGVASVLWSWSEEAAGLSRAESIAGTVGRAMRNPGDDEGSMEVSEGGGPRWASLHGPPNPCRPDTLAG